MLSKLYKHFRTVDKEYRIEKILQGILLRGTSNEPRNLQTNGTHLPSIPTTTSVSKICHTDLQVISIPDTLLTTPAPFTATVIEAASITPSESIYYILKVFMVAVAAASHSPTSTGGNHTLVKCPEKHRYWWSHRFTQKKRIQTCTKPKDRHKKEATDANRLGGSTYIFTAADRINVQDEMRWGVLDKIINIRNKTNLINFTH